MLSDEAMHERMVNGWRMGQPFTVCGNGSTPESTGNIREWLPGIVKKYKIATLADAGAGDMAWWPLIKWQSRLTYLPYDLISRLPEVEQIDITTQKMAQSDGILCRMVLNHLDVVRTGMAIDLFRQTSSYLIATQYDREKLGANSIQFMRLDLRDWLGDPIESCPDGHDKLCTLALWRL